ncbi:MAG: biotin/lipoyl-containing protein, partial [Gemmataceae bacterium]
MEFALPPVGEGLFEVELVRWLVKPGDAVSRAQPIAELMSDKATMELPAPFSGVVTQLHAEAGTKVKVGQPILHYVASSGNTTTSQPSATASSKSTSSSSSGGGSATAVASARSAVTSHSSSATVAAAPSVRHLARKLGIDLGRLRGSGPGGRILIDDLTPLLNPAKPSGRAAAEAPKLDVGTPGSTLKLAGLRRKIAEKMVASKRSIPHYSYVDEVDLSELVRLRQQLREPLAARGVKLTYLAFIIKAVARALREVPI